MDISKFASKELVSTELLAFDGNHFRYAPHLNEPETKVAIPLIDHLFDEGSDEGIRFSFFVHGPASMIPMQVDAENKARVLYTRCSSAGPDERKALDLFFDLREIADIDEWAHRKNTMLAMLEQFVHSHNLHMEGRAVVDRIYDRGDDNKLHYAVFRIWSNKDWPCVGHPEMLTLAPMGQHHCGHCGEFVVAGIYHMEKENVLSSNL